MMADGKEVDASLVPARRRLTAFVHADVVGFSRLVGHDDQDTSVRLRRLRNALIDPLVAYHGGSLVNAAGDEFLASFASVTAAVACAVELQTRLPEFDEGRPADQRIRLRAGIEVGDILADGQEPVGEGVNIAARLQALCPPGGVCVSRAVRDHVQGRLNLSFTSRGTVQLKNISRSVEAFVLNYQAGSLTGTEPARSIGARFRSPRMAWPAAVVLLLVTGVGAVAVWALGQTHSEQGSSAHLQPPGLSAPPASIAVLPFANLSGDPEQAYLADGIAEDLTTDLSHLKGATVIARESAFTYKGRDVDVREVGRQLGVRFVIEGSVRKMDDMVRVNAQLVSTETGGHLWAKRFDKPIRGLESGMDEVVGQIGAALDLKLTDPQQRTNGPAAPGNAAAFDLVLRARSVLNDPWSDVRNAIARGLFEQALRLEPTSAPAMAGVASMLVLSSTDQHRASMLVASAERIAPNAPEVLAAKFQVMRSLRRYADSVATFRRLLDIDSSAAGLAVESGWCTQCWGAPEDAIPLLERTASLNPRSPNSWVIDVELGRMLILVGRDADAIQRLERATVPEGAGSADQGASDRAPVGSVVDAAQIPLAAAYALSGKLAEAHALIAAALQRPYAMDLTLGRMRRAAEATGDPKRRAEETRLVEGLRLAGLRERLDETADSHIPSTSQLRDFDQLNAPTPMSVPGGTTLLTEQFEQLLHDSNPVVITTANANPTVPGAVLMPFTFGGSTADEWQGQLDRLIAVLTHGDRHRLIVTLAASINRWHARNVALRLIALGYDHVYWYRGGIEAWESLGLPMAPVIPQAR